MQMVLLDARWPVPESLRRVSSFVPARLILTDRTLLSFPHIPAFLAFYGGPSDEEYVPFAVHSRAMSTTRQPSAAGTTGTGNHGRGRGGLLFVYAVGDSPRTLSRRTKRWYGALRLASRGGNQRMGCDGLSNRLTGEQGVFVSQHHPIHRDTHLAIQFVVWLFSASPIDLHTYVLAKRGHGDFLLRLFLPFRRGLNDLAFSADRRPVDGISPIAMRGGLERPLGSSIKEREGKNRSPPSLAPMAGQFFCRMTIMLDE